MLLKTVLEQLEYGELSQIVTGDSRGGGMSTADYPEVFNHLNMGLVELHKRFNLRTDYVVLQTQEGVRRYYLREDFAQSNADSMELTKYLQDSADAPFRGFLKVDWIKDLDVEEGLANELPINDKYHGSSVYMPNHDTLEPKEAELGHRLQIHYRQMPQLLDHATYDPAVTKIELPMAFVNALCLFVAARSFSPFNGEGGVERNLYLQRFEHECQQLANQSMQETATAVVHGGFDRGGWV